MQGDNDIVELASSHVAMTVNISNGAKITSLRDRVSQREWLLQPATTATTRPRYGSVFTDEPLAGWDEMFPTVDACRLRDGVELPDHGEVWSRPWRIGESSATSLACDIDGIALDYRIGRRIEVSGPTVTVRYRVETARGQGISALWAAHPQFAVKPGTMLELPAGVDALAARQEGTSGPFRRVEIGSAGLDWRDIVEPGQGMMLYADPATRLNRIAIVDPDGPWLAMAWDNDQIPYFALWIDNECYAQTPVVCPEPMSGYYDSLRQAQDMGRVLEVTAEAPVEWTMRLTVGGN